MGEGFYANTTKEFPIAKNVEVANGVITERGKNGVSNAEVPRFVFMAWIKRNAGIVEVVRFAITAVQELPARSAGSSVLEVAASVMSTG